MHWNCLGGNNMFQVAFGVLHCLRSSKYQLLLILGGKRTNYDTVIIAYMKVT